MLTTTIYQKYISRYADYFTLIEMEDDNEYHVVEIIPSAKVAKLTEDEFEELQDELMNWQNEKASFEE